jgi:antirestriction protein ArdC
MGNSMLIAMQRPDATLVAGFRAWRALGRQVRKGECSIKIIAPMVVKDREAGDEDATRVLFRSVSVFDISQTNGDPLPEAPCEPITGDSHARCLQPLREYAASMGISTLLAPLDGPARGYYSESRTQIVIDETLPANGKVRTLVHELAHAQGVTYKQYTRGEAEVIVETAATIVCGALGLDTSGESIPYIAGWGESGDLDAIRRHAETVDEIARKIETACGIGGQS